MADDYVKHADLTLDILSAADPETRNTLLAFELMPLDDVHALAHYGRKGMKWYHHIFGVYQSSAKYANKVKNTVKKVIKNYKAEYDKTHMPKKDMKALAKAYNQKNGTKYKPKDFTFTKNGKTYDGKGRLIKNNPNAASLKPGKLSKTELKRRQFGDPNEMTNQEIDDFLTRRRKIDSYNEYVRKATRTPVDSVKDWVTNQAVPRAGKVLLDYGEQRMRKKLGMDKNKQNKQNKRNK